MAAGEGTAKKPPSAWSTDPRSNAALNRLVARRSRAARPATRPEDPRLRVLPSTVNGPAEDATAQDTQSETTIGVLGSNVIIGFNDSGSFDANTHFTGYAHSSNRGLSFTDQGTLPDDGEGDAGDPVVAVDQSLGLVYLSTLGFASGEHLQVFKSSDGGETFGAPVDGTPGYAGTTGEFQDKPWLTVDNFTGTGRGDVYLCWTRFGAGGQEEVRFTRSTDNGATFGPSLGTLVSTGGQGCFVVVGSDHSVHVFYYRGTGAGGQGGDNKLYMRRSTNLGVTFNVEHEVADLLTTTVNGNLSLRGGLRSNSFPHAAVNPANGHLYVVYNDNPVTTDGGDIYFVRSTNHGATWSAPSQINPDDVGRGQFFPTVNVAPNGAAVMIGYYSRANDPADLLFSRRSRLAKVNTTTGAMSWAARSFQLGPDTPVAIGQDPAVGATYMGDYDQIAASSGYFHSSWSDNRDGNAFHQHQPDVFYAKVAQTPAATDPAISLTGPASATIASNVAMRAKVTNGGAYTADELFVVLTLPSGLYPRWAVASAGGRCYVETPLVGCNLGRLIRGGSRTVDLVAFAAGGGSMKTTATVLTSDRDTGPTNNAKSLTTIVTGSGTTNTFSTGDIAVAIPDADTVDVPVDVTTDGTILRAVANVRLDHAFDSDVSISLISPTGTEVALSSGNGGSGADYGSGTNSCSGTPTSFDDVAATSITAGTAPFAGSFRPEEPLSAFAGENQEGGWILRIADTVAGDTGTVGCVQLRIRSR
ncbi:MAG TPA: proprotein convertase P-domain-containing protein [Actinomycetota bacterium]|nr:proprotein convertase P-domain-containing protein [Actinomycetota bacterium]